MAEIHAATVANVAKVDPSTGPGFMVPILTSEPDGSLCVQRCDTDSDTVVEFTSIDVAALNLKNVMPERRVVIGDPQVYAFFDTNTILVGSRSELKPVFTSLLQAGTIDKAVAHQIIQLIGTVSEIAESRLAVTAQIRRSFGGKSAQFLERSFLTGALHEIVERGFGDASTRHSASDLILRARSLLERTNRAQPLLAAHLDEIDQKILGLLTVDRLATLQTLPSRDQKPFLAARDRIRRAPRQEERVAILLSLLLSDYEMGKRILSEFHPYAEYETKSARLLSKMLEMPDLPELSEATVARLVPQFFRFSFPMNRGYTLEYLAGYVGHYPNIRNAIRDQLDRTASLHVHYRKDKIMRHLYGLR